jgi:two-component system, NtrC family, response regulator AtoC
VSASILVVDDAPAIQEVLGGFLQAQGYRVATAGSGREALSRIKAHPFDLIVADIVMPDGNGLEVLDRSRTSRPDTAVILMTGEATVETAVEALRRGASDYLLKPFLLEELGVRVRRLLRDRADLREARRLRPALQPAWAARLVGDSAAMRAVRAQIARCAAVASNVLITGESGTGKELVARAIHATSPRRNAPLVPVNCGAIPEALLESQLFGHVKGAFTSAVQANVGLFLAADGGTLFLDEIAELPFPLQVKLLRVIEEKQVWAVGATRPAPVDVRLIVCTNRELPAEIAAGRFRADLFYRLNVVRLSLPPLRERRDDIPLLVDHFVGRLNAKLDRRLRSVEAEALEGLMSHDWPGNVRELENVLERAMILGDGDRLAWRDLAPDLAPAPAPPAPLREAVRRFEQRHIQEVLARVGYDKRHAARRLGISLASLYRKLGAAADDAPGPAEPARPDR